MSNYKISEDFLLNESDVEQKVLMPLITNSYPEGLGFNYTHIQTKFNLKKLEIDKNSNSKLYYCMSSN